MGIMLLFDTAGNEWCSEVSIQWVQGGTVKATKTFYPDQSTYFCGNAVTAYDGVQITLKKTNLPYHYAKLERILFGIWRYFDAEEFRNASIVTETDLLSARLAASTFRWTLDSKSDAEYMFQLKQPMEVRSDGDLVGVYYIDSSSRRGARLYDIECKDALGVLGDSQFSGGVYSGKSAKAIVAEILGNIFGVEYSGVTDTTLTGIIAPCTRKEAMQQVLFAWGVCAATDGTDKIRIFAAASTPAEIDPNRVYSGAAVRTASAVTEVRVTAHTYTEDSSGTISVGGKQYKDTTQVYSIKNPNVTATDKENVVEVTGATLVSPAIGQAVARRVYHYYARRNTFNGKIVLAGERLGDCMKLPNPWGETNTGNIIRMEITLSNTIAARCDSLGV
nr:MAG TPA: tail protein [Caudoviricetes sp.]